MRRPGPLLAVLLVALSACGSGDAGTDGAAATSTSGAPVPTAEPIDPRRRSQEIRSADVLGDVDVITAVGQHRHLEGTSRIYVLVGFEGEGRFRVSGIAVRTPRFEPLAVEVVDVGLVPGQRVALQVDLGAPVCRDRSPADPLVHLAVAVDDGPPTALELPLPSWLVDELHEERCAQEAVTDRAAVRFGEVLGGRGATVRTEVVLERVGGADAVALTQLTGSVILVVEPDGTGQPLAEVGPADDEARVPVRVTAARCDAHAVSGSTKTFVFHAWLRVGDGEPVRIDLRPDHALEAAMQDAIEACIAGSVTDPRTG